MYWAIHGFPLVSLGACMALGLRWWLGLFHPVQEVSQPMESTVSSAGLRAPQAGLWLKMKKLRFTGMRWLAQVVEPGQSDSKLYGLNSSTIVVCNLFSWVTENFGSVIWRFRFWSWLCHSFKVHNWASPVCSSVNLNFPINKMGGNKGDCYVKWPSRAIPALPFKDFMKYTLGPLVYLTILKYHALSL